MFVSKLLRLRTYWMVPKEIADVSNALHCGDTRPEPMKNHLKFIMLRKYFKVYFICWIQMRSIVYQSAAKKHRPFIPHYIHDWIEYFLLGVNREQNSMNLLGSCLTQYGLETVLQTFMSTFQYDI